MDNKDILTPKEIEKEADFLRERIEKRQKEQRKAADRLEILGRKILDVIASRGKEDLESLREELHSISSKIDNLTEEERFDEKRLRELQDMVKEYWQ